MTVAQSRQPVALQQPTAFHRRQRRTITTEDREQTGIRLREALRREEALLRERAELIRGLLAWRTAATSCVAGLTPRQRQIMDRVLAGQPSKNIAADLGISRRTVENHRAAIMKRTGTRSLPALARLSLGAGRKGAGEPDPLGQLLAMIGNGSVKVVDAEPARSRTGEHSGQRAVALQPARIRIAAR